MKFTRCPIDHSPLYDDDGEARCLAAGHGPVQWARIGVEAPSKAVSAPPAPKPCPTCGSVMQPGRDGTLYCSTCRARNGGARPGTVWNHPRDAERDKSETIGVW